MLVNYIKLSIRLMARKPLFTFIKVSGLAIGLAMFLILWQYTQSELRSDEQWKDAERIYRFGVIGRWTDDKTNWDQTYYGTNIASVANEVALQYPEITELTRLLTQPSFLGVTKDGSYVKDHGPDVFLSAQAGTEKKTFKETRVAYGDPNLFTFFGLPLVEGQSESVLGQAGSIVLSEKLAIKYFGTIQARGKTILINDKVSLMVTGVFENLPHNTHLLFDAVVSSEGIKDRYNTLNTDIHAPVHYVKIKQGIDIKDLGRRINSDIHAQIRNAMFGSWPYGDAEMYFQQLLEMPFQSYMMDNYVAKSTLAFIILQGAAIAIILLAWINYINLTSAENLNRMKEVATRRTMGAKVSELTMQFVVESFIINLLALLLALTIVQLVRTPMELEVGFYLLSWKDLLQSTTWILLFVFVSGVLITGFYPAWVVVGLYSKKMSGNVAGRHGTYATAFTTLQYSIAIVIAVLAFAIKGQISFILSHDIGLTKEEVLVLDLPMNKRSNFKVDLNTFLGKVRELQPAVSVSVPGDINFGFINLVQPGVGAGIGVEGSGGVDENYIPLYQIRMLAGRNFLSNNPADSTSILLSETAAKRVGFGSAKDAIGRKVIAGVNGKDTPVTVVGVFSDYMTTPLLNLGYYQSKGAALTYKDFLFINEVSWSLPQKVSFRIEPASFRQSLSNIESAYRESFSDPIFNWHFLDEMINGKYHQHLMVSNQISFFSFLAIGIACLGLLGMMMHRVNNKIKEIGIRKVLGAQLYQIAQVLLNTSAKQIVIAAMIGIPVAYYLTQQYLQKFSERMELQWWHLTLPVMILIVIMVATIATVIWNAAKSNPVEALKHE